MSTELFKARANHLAQIALMRTDGKRYGDAVAMVVREGVPVAAATHAVLTVLRDRRALCAVRTRQLCKAELNARFGLLSLHKTQWSKQALDKLLADIRSMDK